MNSVVPIAVKPGHRTTEFAMAVVVIVGLIAVLLFSRDAGEKHIATTVMPGVAGTYAFLRTWLKKAASAIVALPTNSGAKPMSLLSVIESAFEGLDTENIEASIDSAVEAYVAKNVPASSKLQPEVNTAIAADIALARKVFQVYALTKASGVLAAPLAKLATLTASVPEASAAVKDIQTLLSL